MGDVHDVELPERHGEAEAHRGVEAAEKGPGDERVQEKLD